MHSILSEDTQRSAQLKAFLATQTEFHVLLCFEIFAMLTQCLYDEDLFD